MELNRRDLILKYIVDSFIKTAQPIGSHTLIEQYDLPYSSATIRNEMQQLENDGFLEKTHTSSGRIPSAKGYRYYVENLRNKNVDESIKFQLQTILQEKNKSIEDIIKESCEILSHMTNLASVVLGPGSDNEHLVSLQIIPLSNNSATAVFVTDQGYVENKTFVIPGTISMSDLEQCVKLLNDRLKGTAVSNLIEKMDSIKPLLSDYVKEHDLIYQAIAKAFIKFASDRISLYGQNGLIDQPEFAQDADKLKKMLEFLNNPKSIREIEAEEKSGNVDVKIGNLSKDLDDVSMIRTKLNIPGTEGGTIAVIGPNRMDYEKVMNAMEYVAEQLEKYFRDNEGGEDDVEGRKEKN
ncbi:MAG: heat-inducible transcription repressor HrcA [Bacilli bacterium]|nr:heat-inducible transcription repressor HrcA [Bacilli bacterium]